MPRPMLPPLPEDVWADDDPNDPESRGFDPDDYYDNHLD